jgi:integrase
MYVFPSLGSTSKPMSNNTVRAALLNLGISNDEMTGHGFRASARTILEEVLNYDAKYIEMQLAHVVKDHNGRAYNRTEFIKQRTKMMQRWANYLDNLKSK